MRAFPPSWFIAGQRGSGKSGLTLALCAHWRARGLWLGIVDPVHEHPLPKHGRRYRLPTKIQSLVDRYPDGPPLWDLADMACRDALLRAEQSREAVVVLDDANMVCAGAAPDDAPPNLKLAVHEGRHARCGYLVAVRRAAEVPVWVRSEATHRALFNMTEDSDVAVARRMGAHGVENLGRGHFLHRVMGRQPGDPWGRWHLHTDALDARGNLRPCLLAR